MEVPSQEHKQDGQYPQLVAQHWAVKYDLADAPGRAARACAGQPIGPAEVSFSAYTCPYSCLLRTDNHVCVPAASAAASAELVLVNPLVPQPPPSPAAAPPSPSQQQQQPQIQGPIDINTLSGLSSLRLLQVRLGSPERVNSEFGNRRAFALLCV